MRRKTIADILIVIFLITVIILRIISKNFWLNGILTYVSILFAFYSIYVEVEEKYEDYGGRFFQVRGAFLVIAAICTVILAVLLLIRISLPTEVNDLLSLIALLISLPKDLYIRLIGNYIMRKY